MNTPAKDVALKLASALSFTINTDLFVHSQPDDVANCVTVKTGVGLGDDRYQDASANPTQKPGIQILIRNIDPEEGYAQCESIKEALREWNNVSFDSGGTSVRQGRMIQQGDILSLGKQPNSRWYEWSMNFIQIRETIA